MGTEKVSMKEDKSLQNSKKQDHSQSRAKTAHSQHNSAIINDYLNAGTSMLSCINPLIDDKSEDPVFSNRKSTAKKRSASKS